MTDHPYKSLPDKAFWRRAVVAPAVGDVDPVGIFGCRIGKRTKVATAGSCFAQHIARYLRNADFTYFVAEPGHPLLNSDQRNAAGYGLFSARYGNIYTARQLRQLLDRAFNRFKPAEPYWQQGPDVWVDPFRPTAQPGGFVSQKEATVDRAQHFDAVRKMVKSMDVFVFTLGLTEFWRSKEDGAAFPVCPGVSGGSFDPTRYEFYNQPVDEVIEDMRYVRDLIASYNPTAQMILTVSPVPLMATAEPGQNVLSATTYSKSVLRVAAETLSKQFDNVHYFPSYEVITGHYNRGRYFADDLRNVLEDGVSHVMKLFLKYATDDEPPEETASASEATDSTEVDEQRRAELMVEVECDEAALDKD